MKDLPSIIVVLFFLTIMVSCKSQKIDSSNLETLEEQVLKASNNQERLYRLLLGDFIYYTGNKENRSDLKKVMVNDGQDSVIAVNRAFGEVNREGYWIISCVFSSSLPQAPFFKSIKKIKRISRDSFAVLHYPLSDAIGLQEILDLKQANIDLAKFTTQEPTRTNLWVKISSTIFQSTEGVREYSFKKRDDGKDHFISQTLSITLEENIEKAQFYTKEKKPTFSKLNVKKRVMNMDLKPFLKELE